MVTGALLAAALVGLGALAQTAPKQGAPAKAVAAVKSAGRAIGSAAVNAARLLNANSEPGSWLTAGRDYSEQRYSPLTTINATNVKNLGLAWSGDIDTINAQESTPVIVDGAMYLTTNWSIVKAYNAKTGEKLWEYDPRVDRVATAPIACCGTVNRGVAVWNGKVYVAALDGRLIALDGKTGAVKWSVQTTDPKQPYTITQVPRIVRGKVIIGNAGAEYTCRGYVSAYDSETGRMIWRFYTVPDNPNDPNNKDPEILKRYAATWKGEWWKLGGGATAWDTIVYDPKTDLVYFGTGNGLAWSQDIRSPGGGDNLFVSSIIALKPDTGEYVWHYQETPGDEWDYDNTNPLMTADIMVNGRMRHVLMQAPKQAFFYVWDAKTGELLRADQYAPQNWAKEIDLKTGRPVENPAARYGVGRPALVYPAALGAHNWHPMAFSPKTNLVYIPVTENTTAYSSANPAEFKVNPRGYNTGNSNAGTAELFNQPGAPPRGNIKSYLQAWNPSTGKEAWRAPDTVYGAHGVMATAGDLVFTGNADGNFNAFDARTGTKLWSFQTQARVQAAPSTYSIDGEQYVAILVGGGGVPPNQVRTSPLAANNSRILVFKLNAKGALPTAPFQQGPAPAGRSLNPPLNTATNEQVIDGENLYGKNCFTCHGQAATGGGSGPDLRYSPLLRDPAGFARTVTAGTNNGMPGFRNLQAEEVTSLLAYVVRRANDEKDVQAGQAAGRGGGRGGAPAAGGRGGPAPGAAAPAPAGRGGRGG